MSQIDHLDLRQLYDRIQVLEGEVIWTRKMFWLLIKKMGGKVRITPKEILTLPDEAELIRSNEIESGALIFRIE